MNYKWPFEMCLPRLGILDLLRAHMAAFCKKCALRLFEFKHRARTAVRLRAGIGSTNAGAFSILEEELGLAWGLMRLLSKWNAEQEACAPTTQHICFPCLDVLVSSPA